ncbi:putative LysM domain-containing protein [Seiridium cardinale]|uniref:LysM domain-containing protein n=1 Tax=Seiridium cardinale TaxID=138064 RepID=A0ABR2XDZ9_9PEZI
MAMIASLILVALAAFAVTPVKSFPNRPDIDPKAGLFKPTLVPAVRPLRTLAERQAAVAQLFNTSDGSFGLSDSCHQAMDSSVTCSPDGLNLLYDGGGLATDEDLASLCTSSCEASLVQLGQKIAQACTADQDVLVPPTSNATEYIPGTDTQVSIYGRDNVSFRPSSALEYALLQYRLNCLKDNSGWCISRLMKGEAQDCDDCNLAAYHLEMEDARNYDPDLATAYTSLAQSCGKSVTPIATPTTSAYMSSATPTGPSHTCTGSMVPVASSDSCRDFAIAHNIGTEQLLSLNGLTSGCVGFPGGKTSLCVEGSCKTHTVAANDTCASIAGAAGIATIQLLTWNPMLSIQTCDADITQMASNSVGAVLCVGNPEPYTTPVLPWPTRGPTTTAVPTATGVDFDQYSRLSTIWTHPPLSNSTVTSSVPWATPTYALANGSIPGCYRAFDNPVDKLSCAAAAGRYGVDEETWVSWNPAVQHGNASEIGSCYLDANVQYCGIFWDPSLALPHNDTGNVYAPRPSDATEGATENCYFWDKTPESSTSDLCSAFMGSWGITIAEFYAWNPAVGTDCQNLWLNTSYCVQGDDLSTTTSIEPTPTTSRSTTTSVPVTTTGKTTTSISPSVTPPAPTQSGIPSNCNAYAVAQSGDGCWQFSERNTITLDQLYQWNPVLENNCANS